jgi:hypothetical protein
MEMAKYVERHEGISVSQNFVSALWREHGFAAASEGHLQVVE